MKFHVLLPIRDEADIILQSLQNLLQWADYIYVFDTGSVDETWEIVLDTASKHEAVRPLCKDPVYFSEIRLRGYMFHVARKFMRDGDWFLRADADEFHHILPPDFIKTHLQKHETVVYHQYYDFQLTREEVSAWESGKETFVDRAQPIEMRRRYFIPSYYSEPRMCRYRSAMQWPITGSFPINAGFLARERLPIRHYPHRDPVQLERRCRLRSVMMADIENRKDWRHPEQHHWSQLDWQQFIVENDDPRLNYWVPGSELPRYHFTNHLKAKHIRFVQRLVHAFFLPILDRTRPAFPADAYPQPIPDAVTQILYEQL